MRNANKRPKYEIADIIKIHGNEYRDRGGIPGHHLKALSAIERCRTAALGGHVNVCTDCGSSKISYNSCRNRHCPKCGGLARELWIEDRKADLLPVRYQHVVFTLPHELNDFCRYNQKYCYDLLFHAAWNTLNTFGLDEKWLGAKVGATMILHTWGQALTLHPHVHCIIPSGGLKDREWVHPKRGKRARSRVRSKDTGAGFLFPVKAMAKVYRSLFLSAFREAWLAARKRPTTPSPHTAATHLCGNSSSTRFTR